MTLLKFIKYIFLLTILINTSTLISNAQKGNRMDDYPIVKTALNKKVWSSKYYFKITKATDSTVHLFWGNNSFTRKLNEDLEVWPAAERLFIKWSNNDYLILQYGTGSGVWVNLILPINKKEKVLEIGNAICFDKQYNLLGIEELGDTILVVENLKTKKKQFIIDKIHKCEAALNSYCIDKIRIKNKVLFLTWVVPNNFEENKKIYKKKINLKV